MIQKDHLNDEHKSNDLVKKKLKLMRAAANSSLDDGRWSVSNNDPSLQVVGDGDLAVGLTQSRLDPFLPKFEYETPKSYMDRLQFLSSNGATEFVVGSYSTIFSKVEKVLECKEINDDLLSIIKNNIDGHGTSLDDFAEKIFREILITSYACVATDRNEDQTYSVLIPRENVLNWAYAGEGLQFITWRSESQVVDGIKTEPIEIIYAIDYEEFGVEIKKQNGETEFSTNPNQLGYVPVRKVIVNEGSPFISGIAKIEHDLMNLNSEMRKILRDQAGLNLLQIPKGIDMKSLTSRSLIRVPDGADPNISRWVVYPSGSMDSQFGFLDRQMMVVKELSRLRKQKSMPESGIAKKLDFVQAEGILNSISDKVSQVIEGVVRDHAAWNNQELSECKFRIGRDFDIDDINSDIEALIKTISVDFGRTVESFAKRQFRDKWFDLPDDLIEQSDSELDGEVLEPPILNIGEDDSERDSE